MICAKICGLKEAEHIAVAAEAGAAYIGFNFFPKSPRYVTFDEAAALVSPPGLMRVGLVVNPDDALLDALPPMDMIQLHGSETPERVAEVKARTGLPVMKALGISGADDLAAIDRYESVADQLLIDAKPPKDATLPGGNGVTFDWTLLRGRRWQKPWLLAGGLTAENVSEAVRESRAKQVDLASGVETAPGVKDSGLIRAFMAALAEPASAA